MPDSNTSVLHLAIIQKQHYRKTGTNARWDSLLDIWKFNQSDFDDRRIVSELKSAFHFRHWLAHGRYWPQKQTFTYGQVYRIVEAFLFLAQLR